MTKEEYEQLAMRTAFTPSFVDTAESADEDNQLADLLHAALGVGTEAGELQDALKRFLIYEEKLDPTNIIEECGDLLWYIVLALRAIGSSLDEAMEKNIAKLQARYPEKFDMECAINRDLDKERAALEAKSRRPPEDCNHPPMAILGDGAAWVCGDCGKVL